MRVCTPYLLAGSLALVVGAVRTLPGENGRTTGSADSRAPVAETREVEVRFANGSTVLLAILQDNIEIATAFGKLTIPPRDIRQIDFGVHLSEETQRRIDADLKQLSSDIYRLREAALKDLVALGPQSFLALHRVAKGSDEEAAKRAQTAIKHIVQKVNPRLLRLQEDDRIRTSRFTIVGQIVTPAIKARAEYFGDLSLKPSQLLTMRWLETAGENEVVIDAAKYGSAQDKWLDTGIRVEPQLGLKITAAGQVDLWPQQPGQYMAGPGGMNGAGGGGGLVLAPGGAIRQGASGGTLMGRIGEDGSPFLIGERNVQTPTREGRLYLHIIPSPWGNASIGTYRVRVTMGPNAAEGDD